MDSYLRRGTPAYRRATLAMFCAGFSSFALLYTVQPLLPLLARAFRVGPAEASLAMSMATGGMACALLIVGALSDRLGRKALMSVSMFAVVAFTLAAAAAPSWPLFLTARFLAGASMSGVPAVAMAYLAEEVEPEALGAAMGLYIGSGALGGMGGRMFAGVLADLTGSWRLAVAGFALVALVTAILFVMLLPPSRRFVPAPPGRALQHLRRLFELLRDPALPWLCGAGFIMLGVFVATFNGVTFRLSAPPFSLPNTVVGAIFLVYLVGAPVSTAFGRLSDRFGRPGTLIVGLVCVAAGLAITLPDNLFLIAAGLALVTCGFFGAHAIASAWAASRAPTARGQAAALYLLFYYLGPFPFGALGGALWSRSGWTGLALCLGLLMLAPAAIVALRLKRLG
jgi:YNFM family putative membrane transporter